MKNRGYKTQNWERFNLWPLVSTWWKPLEDLMHLRVLMCYVFQTFNQGLIFIPAKPLIAPWVGVTSTFALPPAPISRLKHFQCPRCGSALIHTCRTCGIYTTWQPWLARWMRSWSSWSPVTAASVLKVRVRRLPSDNHSAFSLSFLSFFLTL